MQPNVPFVKVDPSPWTPHGEAASPGQHGKPTMRRNIYATACLLSSAAIGAVVISGYGKAVQDPLSPPLGSVSHVRRGLQTPGDPPPRLVNTGKYKWSPPTATELARLDRSLASLAKSFDAEASMTTASVAEYSPGYATKLTIGTVHPTKDSLWYALGLLDTGREEGVATAVSIVNKVVPLQDRNSSSRTWGTWPWFLEEPLSDMASPDLNWMDFNGITLLEILRSHQSRLPVSVSENIWAAVLTAARGSMRRNTGPSYTNVCVAGTYLTLVAGEALRDAALREHGEKRLKRLADYTTKNGGFDEYNSPAYIPGVIQDLSRLRAETLNATVLPVLDKLLTRAWEEVATHFHVPTWQWGGPHSRNYATLLRKANLAFIMRGTNGSVTFPGVDVPGRDDHRVPLLCPRTLWPHFRTLASPRTVKQTFITATQTVGTTYLHPHFTLGSINRGDMWAQRRALVSYFNNASSPLYLHARFLKDNRDFASAYLTSAQDGGRVAGAVTFFTDGGDTHVSLSMVQNATIRASDLRLRFELGGAEAGPVTAAAISVDAANGSAIIGAGNMSIALSVPYARLDSLSGRLVSGGSGGLRWVDVELYKGTPRTFTLSTMQEAAVAFVLSMAPAASPSASSNASSTSTGPRPPAASVTISDAAAAQKQRLIRVPTDSPPSMAASVAQSPVLTLRSGALRVTVPIKPLDVATRNRIDSGK